MHAGGNYALIKCCNFFQRILVVSSDDLENFCKCMLFVAGINPLGRETAMEIVFPFHAGMFLQNRNTDFLGCSWINGGFVNNGRSPLHMFPDGFARAYEGSKIGLMGCVYGCWNRYDNIIRM